MCILSPFCCVWLFATLWTVARQAPPSMGSSRQECWGGLPCPPPGDLPNPGMEVSLVYPSLAGRFLTTWDACKILQIYWNPLNFALKISEFYGKWIISQLNNFLKKQKPIPCTLSLSHTYNTHDEKSKSAYVNQSINLKNIIKLR